MPAVQNPHWNAAASTKAVCTGCGASGDPRPATVVTVCPSSRCAGNRQECTAEPSTSTEQAPQSPASQPFLAAVIPASRSTVRSTWPGRGVTSIGSPSTVMRIVIADRS